MLTDADLDAIMARRITGDPWLAYGDVPALVAEVRRLRQIQVIANVADCGCSLWRDPAGERIQACGACVQATESVAR